jgi:hypothetical protein
MRGEYLRQPVNHNARKSFTTASNLSPIFPDPWLKGWGNLSLLRQTYPRFFPIRGSKDGANLNVVPRKVWCNCSGYSE